MQTKTFKAETMIQTLQMVQAEFGASALVVSMRDVPLGPFWNPWQKTGVEIVASSANPAANPPAPRPAAPAPIPQKPGTFLRPAENQAGVEFVEERPEIEWAVSPTKQPPPLKLSPAYRAAAPTSPDSKVSRLSDGEPAVTPAPQTPQPVAQGELAHSKSASKTAAQTQAESRYLSPALKKIQAQLSQQGVDETLIQNLLVLATETLSPTTLADTEACQKAIMQLLETGLRVQKGAGAFVTNNIVCVVGASGSGKTSVTAKLALFFSENLHKKVTWVCADTVRTGAVAEARAYADALGVTLKLVYTPADLKDILSHGADTDLFLVDTPGYNPCSEAQMSELGALLAEMPRRTTYLTAPATTRESDLLQSAAVLGMFNLDGLVITKLDETRTFGGIYNFARRQQIPLGFLTTGREAARHLEVAAPARLVAALFGRDWSR